MSTESADVMEPRHWRKNGWVAQVMKNEDDDGWAVAMTRVGDDDPALVGPWTMGRDKKNPKPLDQNAFNTLVKTASEVLRRHEQAALARIHKTIVVTDDAGVRVRVDLDLVADDDDPHAILSCRDDATGAPRHSLRVPPNFKLTSANTARFIESGTL